MRRLGAVRGRGWDPSLALVMGGALIFGAGRGLVGYCPGPALAALGFGATKTFGFVAAPGLGMLLHHLAFERR